MVCAWDAALYLAELYLVCFKFCASTHPISYKECFSSSRIFSLSDCSNQEHSIITDRIITELQAWNYNSELVQYCLSSRRVIYVNG